MNRFSYLLGPETLWALIYLAASLLVARNQPPTKAGSEFLESLSWWFVIGSAIISFLPMVWASLPSMPGNAWWMLLRIAVSGAIGVCVVVTKLCGGIDYGNSRNSGLGAAFIMWIILGWMVLFAGAVISAFWIFVKARADA